MHTTRDALLRLTSAFCSRENVLVMALSWPSSEGIVPSCADRNKRAIVMDAKTHNEWEQRSARERDRRVNAVNT